MKILISITRTLVGILFIFSGLVKADDPLGLSYKMQEFFEVWNFHWLDHFTLAFSILMIVFEIVAGVALLLGWRIRLFSWLLLLLILFFTFLTGYAYLSGKVRECGCFGDCIPLTAGQSFTKDLVLLLLIVFLFGVRDRIRPVLRPPASATVFIGAAIFSFLFQWYALVRLPVVDCLPYKAGTNIPDKMKPPPGAIPDSTVITMVYEKDGKRVEFDATHFPADYSDSYHFISRYDKLIRKGNSEPAIKDFDLTTGENTDTTEAVLAARGFKLFIFMMEVTDYHPAWNKDLSVVLTMARAKQIPVFFITGEYENMMNWVGQQGLTGQVTVLKCDGTAIKTAARANPTLYLIKGGTILRKWSYADFRNAIPAVNELPSQ
jgi:uncharacterized membrane protein YphA (DoxX/SURF4 family)